MVNTTIDLDKAINHSLSHKTTFRSLAEYLYHEAKFTDDAQVNNDSFFLPQSTLSLHQMERQQPGHYRFVHPVQRAEKAQKKTIKTDQPAASKHYNSQMGGTDLMDQNVGCYRIIIRSKK